MRNKDEKIYNILKEDAMIPSEVERAIQEAYTKLENREAETDSKSMDRKPKRKFRAAAAVVIAALAIGTTAYATARHSAISNYFSMFGQTLPEQAKPLIETEIAQEKTDTNNIVNFTVREALCDKNTIIVSVEAKAADKYLLVPCYYGIQNGKNAKKRKMADLNQNMPEKKMKIADYVKKYNKEILPIDVGVDTGADDYSSVFNLEEDGTAVFTYVSENVSKEAVMNLSCQTTVLCDGEYVMDTFDFTVNDKSKETETAIYRPESSEPIEGTNIIIDELKFEKSEIDITSTLTYHYADNKGAAIGFLVLGPDGKLIKNGPGVPGGVDPEGNGVFTETKSLALIDLPEELTLWSEDIAPLENSNPIKVYRVDPESE